MKKKLIIICGATATGKTALAIQVAQFFETSILSFDSRQCYKELNIGVAKPNLNELNIIPHYFIDSHSIHDNLNAAVFEKFALNTLQSLFNKKDIVVAVGGTGLYLNALCNGVDNIPTIPDALRSTLREKFAINGLEWLQSEIKKLDKSFSSSNDLNNVQRMLRALEVVKHTGNSIKFYQTNQKVERDFEIVKFGIEMDRKELYDRIEKRVDIMIENGLIDEVRSLMPFENLNALQTVGYTELIQFFKNDINLKTAIALIKQHTRNYAKRQVTWFKKDQDIKWGSCNSITESIKNL